MNFPQNATGVHPLPLLLKVVAGTRSFGAFPPQNVILFRRELLLPFLFGLRHRLVINHGIGVPSVKHFSRRLVLGIVHFGRCTSRNISQALFISRDGVSFAAPPTLLRRRTRRSSFPAAASRSATGRSPRITATCWPRSCQRRSSHEHNHDQGRYPDLLQRLGHGRPVVPRPSAGAERDEAVGIAVSSVTQRRFARRVRQEQMVAPEVASLALGQAWGLAFRQVEECPAPLPRLLESLAMTACR